MLSLPAIDIGPALAALIAFALGLVLGSIVLLGVVRSRYMLERRPPAARAAGPRRGARPAGPGANGNGHRGSGEEVALRLLTSGPDRLRGASGLEVHALPRPPASATVPDPVALRPSSDLSRRILVVEDDPLHRKVVIDMLLHQGHRADGAFNGIEAVELARRNTYDVIFMDVKMPVLDGIEATRAIRSYEGAMGRHTPIIAMTAYVLPSDRVRFHEAGMDDYLSKPVDGRGLGQMIVAWCPGTGHTDASDAAA